MRHPSNCCRRDCRRKTIRSAKELGAEGVQLETRFLASEECNIHEKVKELIVNRTEDEIFKLRHGRMASNFVKNKFVEQLLEETENGDHIGTMEKFEREEIGMYEGNVEEGLIMAGQSIGRIKEIKSVREIAKRIGEVFLSSS